MNLNDSTIQSKPCINESMCTDNAMREKIDFVNRQLTFGMISNCGVINKHATSARFYGDLEISCIFGCRFTSS